MSAKKSRRRAAAAEKSSPFASQQASTRLLGWQVTAVSLAVGFGWLCYLMLFATAEMPSLPPINDQGDRLLRLQLWLATLDPALLLQGWIGGDWQRVGLAARLWVGGWSLLLLALAYGPGRAVLDALLPEVELTRLERHLFALALGLHIASLSMLALGLAGGLAFGWLTLVPAALGWGWLAVTRLVRRHSPVEPSAQLVASRGDGFSRSLLWATFPFLAVILLGAMLPPHDFDVREYHLQVPKEWYQQGYIGFLPHNVYGNMPLGAEMHPLLAMCLVPGEDSWWWGALIGKTVMASFVPLTAAGLYAAGRRWFTPTAGAVAALAYVSTPWIARTAMKGLNEPAVACYTLLAVYAVWLGCHVSRWRGHGFPRTLQPARHAHASVEHGTRPGTRIGCYLLAGLLAGAAVACKYPALLFVGVPLAVWPILCHFQNKPKQGFLLAGAFLLAMFVSCQLWLVKNAVLAGNPTYPLLYEWFGGLTRNPANNAQWQAAHGGDLQWSLASAGEALSRVAWRSEWLSPLVVPLAAIGIVAGWRGRRAIAILSGAMLLFAVVAWYALTHRIDRFLVPLLPLACLLAGIGASWSVARSWRLVLGAMLGLGLLLNFATIGSFAIGDVRLLVDLEQLRQDDPLRVDPVHAWLNAHAPAGSKVLLVGDAEPFDLEISAVYNTTFDESQFERLLRGKSAAERKAALREAGVTHVYLHWGHIERYRSPGNYGFTNFVTHELIERELVEQQHVLEEVPEFPGALYRVVQ